MNRQQLEHVLRASAGLYPLEAPEKADLIDGSIGELSPFHDAFGYYAHGVGVETAVLPSGWRDRWIRVESEGAIGWCLSPVDLAVSKLAAGRSKDIDFVRGMLEARILEKAAMARALDELLPERARAVGAVWEICLRKAQ